MTLRTYSVINKRNGSTEAIVTCTPPTSSNSKGPDWKDLFRALDQLKLPYVWVGGILEHGGAVRMIDAYGYVSHYLEPKDAAWRVGSDRCPKCGERGMFLRMALVCRKHGAFAGLWFRASFLAFDDAAITGRLAGVAVLRIRRRLCTAEELGEIVPMGSIPSASSLL